MDVVREAAVHILAWVGTVFIFLAAVGLVRMPDVFLRMQASTKAATLGVVCIAGATAVAFGDSGITFRAIMLTAFIFITAPIAAHLIARASSVTGSPLAKNTVADERYPRDHEPGDEG